MRFVPQLDPADCGPACLVMAASHYGTRASLARVRQSAGTDANGTNLAGLVRAGQDLGFRTEAFRGDCEALASLGSTPVILHLRLGTPSGDVDHFAVLRRQNPRRVVVWDPQYGQVTMPWDQFDLLWTGYLVTLTPDQGPRPGPSNEGALRRFLPLLDPHRRTLVGVALASLTLAVLGILTSLYYRVLVDDVLPARAEWTLHAVGLAVLLATGLQVLLEASRKKLLLVLSTQVDFGLLFTIVKHLFSLPLSTLQAQPVGDLVSRLDQISEIREAMADGFLVLTLDLLLILSVGTVLAHESVLLFFLSLVSVPATAAVVAIFARWFRGSYQKLLAESSQAHAQLVEALSGAGTVKALNGESRFVRNYRLKQNDVLRSALAIGQVENHQSLVLSLIRGWASQVLTWAGALLVLHGELTLGQLLSFGVLAGFFTGPLQRLVNLQPQVQKAIASARRIAEILDLEPETSGSKDVTDLSGPLELRNVCFCYGTRRNVLRSVSLKVNSGEQVALVGASGSGKSTIIKLLLRLYDATDGDVLIGGHRVQDLTFGALRGQIGYVPQDIVLFSGTIADNLRWERSDISDDDLWLALERAGADDFVRRLPRSLGTEMGDRGSSFSGGERQRLALARALVRKPKILVLDEATSQLDPPSERAFLDRLKTLRGPDLTILMVAHRLTSIVDSDRIIVFDGGAIVAEGTHQNLLNSADGPYRYLWTQGGNPAAS